MSGGFNLATRANTSGRVDSAGGANVWMGQLGNGADMSGSNWPPEPMSKVVDLATGADTSGRVDLAAGANMSGRVD